MISNMEITSKSLSHGIGGSYTKWQRKPPAHRIYKVETPEGITKLIVHAENRAVEDADHATVQSIETATNFARDLDWENLSDEVQEAVREHFEEKVKDDEWFN